MEIASQHELACLVPVALYLIMFGLVGWTARRFMAIRAQYGRVAARCGLSGMDVANRLLAHLGLVQVGVRADAPLDHYDYRRRQVSLHGDSAVSASVTSLAIAAHEVGHAEQFAQRYWAAEATRWVVRAVWVVGLAMFAILSWGVISQSLLTSGMIAIALGGGLLTLRLPVTLALERDASRRAGRIVRELGLADDGEWTGFHRVLHAGFCTHLALSAMAPVMLLGAAAFWPALCGPVDSLASAPPAESASNSAVQPIRLPEPIELLAPVEQLNDAWPTLWTLAMAGGLVWWVTRRRKAGPNAQQLAAEQNNLGLQQLQRGNPREALAHFDRALARQPTLAEAYYNRAYVHVALGQIANAAADLDQVFLLPASATESLQSQAEVWLLRGGCRLASGDLDGSLSDLNEAIARPNAPAQAWLDRGFVRLERQEYAAAKADFDEALRRDRSDAIAYNNRGVALMNLGETSMARDDFQRAILLDPNFARPREHLAELAAFGSADPGAEADEVDGAHQPLPTL